MARLKTDEQLEAFRRQQVEIAKKIRQAEARKRDKAKRDELRRCQVLGAAALEYFSQPAMLASRADFVRAMLRARKLSAADLALFEEMLAPDQAPTAAPSLMPDSRQTAEAASA